jgi:hypothetical protein
MNEEQRNEIQAISWEEWNKLGRETKESKELINALVLGQADLIRQIRENTVKINGMPDEGARQQAFHALYRASERRVMQFDQAVYQAQKIVEEIGKGQTQLLAMLGEICKKVDSFDKIRGEISTEVKTLQGSLQVHAKTIESNCRFIAELEKREEKRWDISFKVAIIFAILFLVSEILIRKFT